MYYMWLHVGYIDTASMVPLFYFHLWFNSTSPLLLSLALYNIDVKYQ